MDIRGYLLTYEKRNTGVLGNFGDLSTPRCYIKKIV